MIGYSIYSFADESRKEGRDMKHRWNKILEKMCMFAITIAAMASTSCRAHFYEPEEPEGLEDFNRFLH